MLTRWEKSYLPQILGGLAVTGKHILGAALGKGAITVQYPEEQHIPSANYRGVHRLNKDEQGRVKCVACMLCATACPAHCIDIVGATAPDTWPDREKYCESFVIDELRCIYCGMCEEACPVEAIELTGLYDLTGLSREQMIFDKTKLLSVFDLTKDVEPMKYTTPPGSQRPGAHHRAPDQADLRTVRAVSFDGDHHENFVKPRTNAGRTTETVDTLSKFDLITTALGHRPWGEWGSCSCRTATAGPSRSSPIRSATGCRPWPCWHSCCSAGRPESSCHERRSFTSSPSPRSAARS